MELDKRPHCTGNFFGTEDEKIFNGKNSEEFNTEISLETIELPHKGRAVVAKKIFEKGAPVLKFHGQKKHVSELTDLTHALQIDRQMFLAPSGQIDDYVNHSCNPNTGIRNDPEGGVYLFALKTISLGDEITFDYATTQSGGFLTMVCECGEPHCRGIIGDFKDLPLKKQQLYRTLGALLDYLY